MVIFDPKTGLLVTIDVKRKIRLEAAQGDA
jgi:hypothetical protein